MQLKNLQVSSDGLTDEEWEALVANIYSNWLSVIVQHGASGLLCVPFVFGIDTFPTIGMHPYHLVRLGGMCEFGWEMYDIIIRTAKGDSWNLLCIVILHHACAQLLVVPCNMYMAETSWAYAASICNLQGLASIGL